MKRIFASTTAALLVLTSCDTTEYSMSGARGPYRIQGGLPASTLAPAHQAAAVARNSPGFVATPRPKFSGAGTPQPTVGYFPEDRRYRSNYRSYGYPGAYGNPYGYGNRYGNRYGYPGGGYYRY